MLKVLDFTRQLIGTITDYDDLTIDKTIEDSDEKISFSYLGDTQIPAEGYVQTDRARYTIKEVEPGDDSTEYRGQLDLEDLQRVPFKEFSSTGQTLQATAAAALANTGWLVSVDSSISGVRNVRRIKKTPLEILYAIRDAWMCEIRFDNLNNTVYFANQIGEDRGVYLMRGLNLIKLRPVYDSYDYVTRIIPYGADGLTIEEVNEGIPYVENYQYSTKILTLIWEDTEYEDAQALKEDAIKKLADLSKPKTAYSCEVLALAKMQTKYSVLDYDLGDTVRLYDAMLGVDEKQRIVRYVEHPDAPEQDTCEISNTILTFEQLQAKYEAAANAWEDISNGDGTVNGVYVHGVQADDVVGIETVINENALVQAGVTNVIVEYAQGDSPTEAPESGWSPTAPEWDSGKYMWQRTRLRHASGTEEQTAETNITGATGKGVAQQIAYYALGSTDEYPPVVEGFLLTEDEQDLVTENGLQIELEMAWTTDVPERHDGEFIWMFMRTVYSDGTYSDTDKVCLTGDKGDTGSQGIQGPPGEDGVSLYTWLKYADTPTSGMSDDPEGKDYIGLAYNKESPIESSNYDDYNWSLVKGEQGDQGIPGPAGDDGESLYTWLKYANDASGSGMSDDPTGKDYIGLAYNKTTQTESQNPQDYIWSKIKGETGATGVGIASVIEYYAKSATTTAPADSQFSTSIQTIDEVNRYLWNYEVITYTDNTTERTGKRIIGVYGLTGPQGAQGVSITGVTNYYLATAASSGVTPDTPGWTTSVQNVTSTNKYLWNYEVVSFSSGSPSATNPCIIGSYGDKGDKGDTGDTGDTGVSISSVTNYYLATSASSGVTPSTPGWTTSIQTMTSTNQYLWNYEVVTGDNGSTISSTSPCIIGRYGQDGSPGAAGKGISSITEYYQVSTSNTTAPTTWETTVPTTDETNRYLWNYEHIAYTDGSMTDSAKRVIGTYGDRGNGISSVTISYGVSSSESTQPATWQPSVPTVSQGDWLWVKTVTAYTDGNPDTTYTKSYIGTDGEDGTSVFVQSATKVGDTTTVVIADTEGHTNTLTIVDGEDGDDGAPGANGYVHTAWANSADGSVDFSTSVSTNKEYLGVYTDNTAADSQDYHSYSWSKIKGEQGPQGIQGPQGPNGITYYTWLKYADTPTSGMSDDPTEKDYIGLAYNKTSSTESQNYSDYTWSKIKGEKGDRGVQGPTGPDGASLYTWVKYADDASGTNMSDSPIGKPYIGLAYNKTSATESQTPSDYTWSLIKGDKGDTGDDGRGVDDQGAEYCVAPPGTIPTNETEIGMEDGTNVLCEDGTNMRLESIWKVQVPDKPDLWFVWMRIRTAYSDGTQSLTEPAMISGADAVSIEEQKDQWYLSTSNTTQTGGSWQDNPPQYIKGRYYWKRTVTTWTDGSVDTSAPVLDYTVQCATTALDSANGKTVNFYQSEQPASTDRTVGDTWFKLGTGDDASNIIAIYKWNGAAWDPQEMTSGVFAYIDAGAITTGELRAIDINGVNITGDGIASELTAFTVIDEFDGEDNPAWEASNVFEPTDHEYRNAYQQSTMEADGLHFHAEYEKRIGGDTPGEWHEEQKDYDLYEWSDGLRTDGALMADGAVYAGGGIHAQDGTIYADGLKIAGFDFDPSTGTTTWYGSGGSKPSWWKYLDHHSINYDSARLSEVLELFGDKIVTTTSNSIKIGGSIRVAWGHRQNIGATAGSGIVSDTVVFPDEFSSAPFVFLSIQTPNNSPAGGDPDVIKCAVHLQSATATRFTAKVWNTNPANAGKDFDIQYNWIAIGPM